MKHTLYVGKPRARLNWSTTMAALALFAAAALASDMYPPGHFQRVSELTADTFDGVVKREVDAGRTLFVRWIASPK